MEGVRRVLGGCSEEAKGLRKALILLNINRLSRQLVCSDVINVSGLNGQTL